MQASNNDPASDNLSGKLLAKGLSGVDPDLAVVAYYSTATPEREDNAQSCRPSAVAVRTPT